MRLKRPSNSSARRPHGVRTGLLGFSGAFNGMTAGAFDAAIMTAPLISFRSLTRM